MDHQKITNSWGCYLFWQHFVACWMMAVSHNRRTGGISGIIALGVAIVGPLFWHEDHECRSVPEWVASGFLHIAMYNGPSMEDLSSFFAMLKYQNGYSEDWIVPIHFSRSLDQGSISPALSTALGRKQRWKGFIRAARVKGMQSATEIEDGFKFYHPPGILPINIDPENSSVMFSVSGNSSSKLSKALWVWQGLCEFTGFPAGWALDGELHQLTPTCFC